MRLGDCAQNDRRTDANQFYNVSHAMCYSCGADNNGAVNPVQLVTLFIRLSVI